MAGIKGGSIYYTVGVDRKSLQDAMRHIEALGGAAARANKAYASGNSILSQYEDEVRKLSASVATLTNDFKRGTIGPDQYAKEMRVLEANAEALRGAIENLGSSVLATSQDESRAADMTKNLAAAMRQAGDVTGGVKGEFSSLGVGVNDIANRLVALNAQVRAATQAFESGTMTAKQYESTLKVLRAGFNVTQGELAQLTNGLKLNEAAMKRVHQMDGQIVRGTTAIQKGLTRATGAMTQMNLASQLSLGGLTLLNDRIFQLSPALGILTNQLMFTTKGFQAFLRAALPIVAVAGSIIAAIGGIIASLRAGTGLETALANVRKTTDFTARELNTLVDAFQATAKEIPVTTMEMLEMAQVAGQLGIRGVRNVEQFAITVAKLATATDVVGEQGATSLARFLQATGTAMSSMGREAERAANVLNELENTTAATAAEILDMTSYTAGLAAAAGFTQSEILGVNAAILSLGVQAEAGGSAILRSMNKIQVAASDGGAALDAFARNAGMTSEAFQTLVRESPIDALLALTEGMNESARGGRELNDILNEMGIREVRERRTLLALSQGYETFAKSIETARLEAVGLQSLNTEVEIQSNTLAAKLQRLGSRFVTLAQNIGSVLIPAAKILVDVLTALVDQAELLTASVISLTIYLGTKGLLSVLPIVGAHLSALGAKIIPALTKASRVLLTTAAIGGLPAIFAGILASLPTIGLTALAALLAGGVYLGFRAATRGARELKEATDEMNQTVEIARTALEGVSRVDQLEVAFDTISRNLSGPYKEAWDKYIEGIELTDEATVNLIDILEQAMEKLDELTLSPLRVTRDAIITELSTGLLSRADVGNILNQTIPEGLDFSIEGMRRLLGVMEDMRAMNIVSDRDLNRVRELIATMEELARKEAELAEGREAFVRSRAGGDGGGGVDDPDSVAERAKRIQTIWENLENARRSIHEKAIAFGWDEAKKQEAILSVIATAIDALIEEGVALDDLDLASLIEEWNRLSAEDALAAIRRRHGERVLQELLAIEAAQLEVAGRLSEEEIEIEKARAEAIEEVRRRHGERVLQQLLDIEAAQLQAAEDAAAARIALEERRARDLRRAAIIQFGGRFVYNNEEVAGTRTEAAAGIRPMDFGATSAARRAEEMERVGEATAAYYEELSRLNRLYESGLITREQFLNETLAAKNEMLGILKTSTIDYTGRISALEGEAFNLRVELYQLANAAQTLDEKLAADGLGKFAEDASKAKIETSKLNEQLSDSIRISNEWADGFDDIAAQLDLGLISEMDFLESRLGLAERAMYALAEATGWFSEETAAAIEEVKRLRALIAGPPGRVGRDGGTTNTGGAMTSEPSSSFGIQAMRDLGISEIAIALAEAASASAVFSSALNSLEVSTDKTTGAMTVSFDPMMMLAQIIMEVLGRSEAFADILAELDKVLEPLVQIVDALFGAIKPVVQVAVALVQTALSPLVWIIENVVAPVLRGFANIIKGVWNAIARIIPGMKPIEDEGRDEETGPPVGSIAWAEERAAFYRGLYENATNQADRDYYKSKEEQYSRRAARLRGESPDSGGGTTVQAGTQISTITGPTRDLLVDLLRPLSILPSWTSMIQDIRNDVRAIAQAGGISFSPPVSSPGAPMYTAPMQQTINIQSLTVTTQAKNARQLFDEISAVAYKERRGGK